MPVEYVAFAKIYGLQKNNRLYYITHCQANDWSSIVLRICIKTYRSGQWFRSVKYLIGSCVCVHGVLPWSQHAATPRGGGLLLNLSGSQPPPLTAQLQNVYLRHFCPSTWLEKNISIKAWIFNSNVCSSIRDCYAYICQSIIYFNNKLLKCVFGSN